MDALYLNTTMVNLLCDLRLDFVIVAQEGNAPTPFRDFRRYRKDCFSDASTSGRDRERVVEYARRVWLVQEQSTSRWNMVCTEEHPRAIAFEIYSSCRADRTMSRRKSVSQPARLSLPRMESLSGCTRAIFRASRRNSARLDGPWSLRLR